MRLPYLRNISVSIAMNPPNCDLRQEIGPFLEHVNILILRLEYDVFELIPRDLEPRNISEIYKIFKERQIPPQAYLIEGHLVAPTTIHDWMRFHSNIQDPAENSPQVERK